MIIWIWRDLGLSLEIYYFSGTGNSLAVARDIALGTGGRLIPITSVIALKTICPDADTVGIVFPIYYEPFGGVPLIVRRFVAKLAGIESKYVFSVVTYGTGSLITHRFLAKLLKSRGGCLSARFSVNMPENIASAKYNNPTNNDRMFENWRQSVDLVCGYVNARRHVCFETPNVLIGRPYPLIRFLFPVLMPLYKPSILKRLRQYSKDVSFEAAIHGMDHSFRLRDCCTGCGTCAKACPVGNISMDGGHPSWQHQCEFCLACFQWCPNKAIVSDELRDTVRYRHPDTKLSDIIN